MSKWSEDQYARGLADTEGNLWAPYILPNPNALNFAAACPSPGCKISPSTFCCLHFPMLWKVGSLWFPPCSYISIAVDLTTISKCGKEVVVVYPQRAAFWTPSGSETVFTQFCPCIGERWNVHYETFLKFLLASHWHHPKFSPHCQHNHITAPTCHYCLCLQQQHCLWNDFGDSSKTIWQLLIASCQGYERISWRGIVENWALQ